MCVLLPIITKKREGEMNGKLYKDCGHFSTSCVTPVVGACQC
jgi:hypothetical protein